MLFCKLNTKERRRLLDGQWQRRTLIILLTTEKVKQFFLLEVFLNVEWVPKHKNYLFIRRCWSDDEHVVYIAGASRAKLQTTINHTTSKMMHLAESCFSESLNSLIFTIPPTSKRSIRQNCCKAKRRRRQKHRALMLDWYPSRRRRSMNLLLQNGQVSGM